MNSTNTTRLYRHRPYHLQREHQQKERKKTETKTSVAIIFVVPRNSDHRLCAEASAPSSSSVLVTREGEKENTENGTEKRRTRGTKYKRRMDELRQPREKNRSLADQVSCFSSLLVWTSDPARPAGFSPATWAGLDPAP